MSVKKQLGKKSKKEIKIAGVIVKKEPKGGFSEQYIEGVISKIDFVINFQSNNIEALREFIEGEDLKEVVLGQYDAKTQEIEYIHQYPDEFTIGVRELRKKDYFI